MNGSPLKCNLLMNTIKITQTFAIHSMRKYASREWVGATSEQKECLFSETSNLKNNVLSSPRLLILYHLPTPLIYYMPFSADESSAMVCGAAHAKLSSLYWKTNPSTIPWKICTGMLGTRTAISLQHRQLSNEWAMDSPASEWLSK